jgi:hypothetical protein
MNKYEGMWYKLLCYYYALTELYDRTLTDLRSPYDETEAYIVESNIRHLSQHYASKVRNDIIYCGRLNKIPNEYIIFNINRNYSAQKWIDEYNYFVNIGEYDKLFNVYDYEIDKEYTEYICEWYGISRNGEKL